MTFKILLSETILFPASCGVQYSTGELIVKGDEGVGVEKGCHMDLFVTNVPRFWGSWAGFTEKLPQVFGKPTVFLSGKAGSLRTVCKTPILHMVRLPSYTL